MPTFCADCANVYKSGKNDGPHRWMCIKHPRLEGFGFVTSTTWDNAPPYLYCNQVNGGACPLYQSTTDYPTKGE